MNDEYAFADAHDAAALGVYLERLLAMDKSAAVRFVGIGHAAAAYSAPPLHGSTARATILTVRTVALGAGTQHSEFEHSEFDRTVSAGQLLESLRTRADGAQGFTLPRPLTAGPSWAGLLPPRTGWWLLGEVTVRRLAEVVAQGNADFRFSALGRDRAALDDLAEAIWSRELAHGLRWRAAHAAAAMGFLGPQPENSVESARVAAHTRWLRLDTPYGTVLERIAGAL
ncbi:hypothetical protein KGA66_12675 [Actinocrinis puniceicyclus]|uniref:Uncharacterized protein n=1 Tax=Actinocrinis puniceicyclus TaxID=977794 RepID=A0A8J7WR57_9ACTN|nr:hypothetical protein [Actinocrinis puniceicyclus]MBS2963904.1 hypothetical protein [Actinocrinis puniceicyclus]